METKDLAETGRPYSEEAIQCGARRPLWQEALMRRLGKGVLTFCPKAKTPCADTKCALQPLCICARKDLASAQSLELRVWLVVAGCAALVLLIAFVSWQTK